IKILLVIIFIIGILLRFYRLGDVPLGFHRDEAFLGYNAYSILLTGKDISGNFLPLHFKSFLYSPSGYSYLSIPFIKLFDLSPFSVRFASAFFGSLTILTTFFLTKQLFKDIRYKNHLSTASALLLSISPWHINLSRTATENTVVVFFITLAVLIYLLHFYSNKWYLLPLSFFCFFITLFIYQAPRVFLPFFIPLLTVLLNTKSKSTMFKIIIFFIGILLPLFIIFSSKDLSLRIRTVSIFATSETQLLIDEQIRTDGISKTGVFLTRLFHNKLSMYTQHFLENYFSHFSYNFLFSDKSLPERYRIPLVGLLYLLELPLLVVGIFRVVKEDRRSSIFLLGWIVIAPVGSALTFDDVPNIQRTLIIFPALSMLEAFGLIQILNFLKKNYWLKILGSFLTIVFAYNVSFYLHQYYTHAVRYRPWYRQDGYKKLVEEVNKYLVKYNKVIVTDRESAPTIFFLFYSLYPPDRFQQETKRTKMKDFDRIFFGRYEFSQEECPLRLIEKNGQLASTGEKDVLYVDSGLCKIPHNARVFSTIKRSDNSLAFFILAPF
ncbi:MAG: glycosyltransferase family 39 protein, partial [Patescibacteria group bacterium]